jgi:hypothetical protein
MTFGTLDGIQPSRRPAADVLRAFPKAAARLVNAGGHRLVREGPLWFVVLFALWITCGCALMAGILYYTLVTL